ncbi:MAG: hydrogenase expression/formation protein HypE [Candidatus Thiodiazotropha sp. (ex Clathrolucina costata)]|nr:hydrogenase expression/formation protein HypE [Candidatus Thiodiazotropha taylori]MCG7863837.1 hydrogenase expression/formation protein HypE [Candidatus Thiodiazotropha endolucinida]
MTLQDTHISLAHGNGGRYMRELIESLFARLLKNPNLDIQADAARLPKLGNGDLLFTTDGFTVQPLEFPGGDIGSLAVHGTTNDLAVSGAIPKYLSLNAFIEEGFEVAQLERIVKSIADAASAVDVHVVAGDTKVVRRGEGGGIYLATTGIGLREDRINLGMGMIRPGDKLLVSGPVGDHGIAVMLAREEFGLRGDVKSDAGSVLPFTQALLDLPGLRFMRDPTRGGVATVAHEICRATGLQVRLDQAAIPVRDPVNSVCEMLGYDPLFLACEGRVVAAVAADQADVALGRWENLPGGDMAALIGETRQEDPYVILETDLGGARILEELEDDPLPRIC